MKTLKAWFEDYSSYHQTQGNRHTHTIGIPLIVVSVLGFFAKVFNFPVHLFDLKLSLDGGQFLWVLSTIWYLRFDKKLSVPFVMLTYLAYLLGQNLSGIFLTVFFVLGWVFQLVGHSVFEKKSPAFTKNLEHLLIGPLWVFAKWTRYQA